MGPAVVRNVLRALACLLPLNAAVALESAAPDPGELPAVTVSGDRPTSLPWNVPATAETLDADEIVRKINATDAEDALKYFPSLLVRKRYIGDYDHAVLMSRASGTGNSARSLVFADGILLSNLLGNGATFTPRWGMVMPEEIERVSVLYGPFSAAYAGNSVGAVVDYITRLPDAPEGHVRLSAFGQHFAAYRTDATYRGWQGSVSAGDRIGPWSLWASFDRTDNDGQPLVFANRPLSAGTPGSAGAPVTGAVAGSNPRNQDWVLIGATNQSHTEQDHAKVRIAFDFSPTVRATYTFGAWRNDTVRRSETYLRDAAGREVWGDLTNATPSYAVNIGGRRYALTPSDFAPSRADLGHVIHGLSLRTNTGDAFDWEAAVSRYAYSRDRVRSPTVFVADPDMPGAGRIADLHGTGWVTLALKGTWRPEGRAGAHQVDFGYQRLDANLRSEVFDTNDWIAGDEARRFSRFAGETVLDGLYVQDTWALAARWKASLGLRGEEWTARNGELSDATTSRAFPARRERYFSPKLSLSYAAGANWTMKASAGRAVRTPTVSELYQGTLQAGQIVDNDPDLAPEKSWTGELTAERASSRGTWRLTAFREITRDALYSQLNVVAGGTVATVQNVDRIGTHGLETAYTLRHVGIPGFDVQASLTWTRSRITRNDAFPASVGKWQPRVPDWRGNLLASYAFAREWSATLGARYSGRQFNQLDNGDTNGRAYTGVSDFFTVDARIRWQATDRLSASLGIDNLNAERYWNFHLYPMRSYVLELGYDVRPGAD